MSLKELFQGIAIVIDDDIGIDKANINSIITQIESKNIPVKTYKELPNTAEINHFSGLAFILLDWELSGNAIDTDDIEQGVRLPATVQNAGEQDNIVFIEKLTKNCFCPIFIFSNHDIGNIESKLAEKKLYLNGKPNRIFIKSKSDIQGASLFSAIESWLQSTPSMYVLKKWQYEYKKSEMSFFNDFQHFSQYWPLVMWECFTTDGVDPSTELGELITQNVFSRMSPFKFCNDILDKQYPDTVDKLELRKILEGERFLPNDKLDKYDIGTGDLFKVSGRYYLNIRANCDLIQRSDGVTLADIELYLLKGNKISDGKISENFNTDYGHFTENSTQSILFPVDAGKAIDFRFKDLEIKKWTELKDKRVGRLLLPYINNIQQRYSLYLQRQGLPRIPNKAISPIAEST